MHTCCNLCNNRIQKELTCCELFARYAEGGDLYTRLREQRDRNEFLSEVQVVRWFIQICMALQYLHQQHILHRDLKTQNIFLTKTKMVKVRFTQVTTYKY